MSSSWLNPSDPVRPAAILVSWVREASLAGKREGPSPVNPIVFAVT
jgi:hypothetical protein